MKKKVNEPFYNGKMEKVVLKRNETAINDLKAQLESKKPFVQQLADVYFNSPLKKHSTDIGHIFRNGADDLKQSAIADLPDELNGFQINKKKFIESGLFQIPAFQNFADVLNICYSHNLQELIQYYQLKGKEVTINTLAVESFEDRHSIKAQTYEEILLMEQWETFLRETIAFNELLDRNCGKRMLQHDAKRLSGLINISAWGEVDKEGNVKVNAKTFEAFAKIMNRRNSNRIQEAED